MTKKSEATINNNNSNNKNHTSIDDIKKSFQSNMNTLLEKDNINNEIYKKRYIELKDKLGSIKKLRFTETEQLFEEFKIKAEQRDSDSRKLIGKLKRELDNYKTSNKVLKETLNSNHGFDCETIRKDILLKVEDDHKFAITQLKLTYDERITQLESTNGQLSSERDQYKERVVSLESEIEKLKQHHQDIQNQLKETATLEKETMEKEYQEKITGLLNQHQQQQQQQEEKEKKEKEASTVATPSIDINSILKSNQQIELYYQDVIKDLKTKFEEECRNSTAKFESILKKSEEKLSESAKLLLKLETEKTDLLGKFQLLSTKFQEKSNTHKELLAKFDELKQNIMKERDEFTALKNKEVESLNKKLAEKSKELQEFKEVTEQSKIELEKEFQNLQAKFDENLLKQLEKKDQDLEEQIKKHNQEMEELEEKLKLNDDSTLPTVESLLSQLKDQKLEMDNLISKNTTNSKYIELYEIFTNLKIVQITDTTYELICQNIINNAKIHLKFTIEEDASYSCSTISIDNCKDENNMFSEDMLFKKEDASSFLVNMLSIVLCE